MNDLLREGALRGSSRVGLWIATIALLAVGWMAVAVVGATTTFVLVMLLLMIFAPAFLWFLGRGGTTRPTDS